MKLRYNRQILHCVLKKWKTILRKYKGNAKIDEGLRYLMLNFVRYVSRSAYNFSSVIYYFLFSKCHEIPLQLKLTNLEERKFCFFRNTFVTYFING